MDPKFFSLDKELNKIYNSCQFRTFNVHLQIYKFQPIYEATQLSFWVSYNAELFCFILPDLITFPEFENVETGLIW